MKKNRLTRAKELLSNTRRAPRSWGSFKETYVTRVVAILQMIFEKEEFDSHAFYRYHIGTKGNLLIGYADPIEEEWAHGVIDDALDIIKENRAKKKKKV